MVVLLAWPFLLHFQLVVPTNGGFMRVGNDFDVLYYAYKPYLLANMAHGRMPMWMPQEGAGFPFILDPFTQALYPGNLAILPIAWMLDHWGPLEHQRYTVAALSVTAIALFFTLRRLELGLVASFVSSLVVVSSYKVTETLRFPNAAHTVAWISIALYCLVSLRVAATIKRRVALGLLLGAAVICMTTAGYPYFVVYFLLTLVPFLLWVEVGTPARFQRRKSGFGVFTATAVVSMGTALLVVAPYLLGVRRLLQQTTDRGGADWDYSTEFVFDGWDYVGSLLLPPIASSEGWFYFGTAGLALVAVAAVESRSSLRPHWPGIVTLVLWCAWIVFLGLSGSNPLFRFVWERFPLVDSLRVWGRINIMLIFPIAFALGVSLQALVTVLRRGDVETVRRNGRRLLAVGGVALGVVVVLQLALALARPVHTTFLLLQGYDAPVIREHIGLTVVAGAVVAAGWVALRWPLGASRPLAVLAATFTGYVLVWIVQLHGIRPNPWMWIEPTVATRNTHAADVPIRDDEAIDHLAKQAMTTVRKAGPDVNPAFDPHAPWNAAVFPNWNYQRYVNFLADTSIDPAERDRLIGTASRTRLFEVDASSGQLEEADARILAYDGSRLVADVRTEAGGELVFADNWDSHWKATVDGRDTEVGRAFGTFKSVAVDAGTSRVELRYCPFSLPVYRWLC